MIEANKYYAIVNFGDESVALMQWLIEQNLQERTELLLVNTKFSASSWQQRVQQAIAYANKNKLTVRVLESRQGFSELVKSRGEFPSKKFQWCAGFLKGTAINEYLDDQDPFCEAVLLFAKRQQNSRTNELLSDIIEESEHYNERTICFPLWEHTLADRNTLITKTGLEILNHRSLECEPCIHATKSEVLSIDSFDKERLTVLEEQIGKTMFSLELMVDENSSIENFDMGCGSYFGCGE